MKKISKNQAIATAIVIAIFSLFLAAICCVPDAKATFQEGVIELGKLLFVFTLYSLAAVVIGCAAFATLRFVEKGQVRTRLQLWGNALSAKIQERNTAKIYPCLQQFLYGVFAQNKDMLHLQLGQDASCLAPRGYATVFRSNCMFYRFELLMPQTPEMDIIALRQIIQQYIDAELLHYGIANLSACFNHPMYGSMPTVFLDRMRYDEKAHLLEFTFTYIATPDAAKYVYCARQRDIQKVTPEREVFDDELR